MLPTRVKANPVRIAMVIGILLLLTVLTASVFTVSAEEQRVDPYDVTLTSAEQNGLGEIIPLDHTLQPGETTTFKASLKNTGQFLDTYDLSVSNAPTGWTVDVSPTSIELYGDASQTVDIEVTAPYTGIDDDYSYTLELDAVSQTDPTNASASIDAIIRCDPEVGYTLKAYVDLPGHGTTEVTEGMVIDVRPGQDLVVDIAMTSSGNIDDIVELLAAGPTVWSVNFPNYKRDVDTDLPASSKSTDTVFVPLMIKVPDTVEDTEVFAFSLTGTSTYAAEHMDTGFVKALTFSLKADFTNYILVETDLTEISMDPGTTVDVEVTVTNLGYVPVTYHPPSSYQMGGLEGFTEVIEDIGYTALEPSDSMTFDITFGAPADAMANMVCEYSITGSADKEVTFIPARVALNINHIHSVQVVTVMETLENVIPGQTSDVTLQVTNNGNGNESVELAFNTYPIGWDVELTPKEVFLVPGQTANVTLSPTSPIDTEDGTYDVSLKVYRVNYDDVGNKHYFLATTSITTFSVANVADLVVNGTFVSISNEYPEVGELIYINVTVANIGGATAENVEVIVQIQTLSGSVKEVGRETIPTIDPGMTDTVYIPYTAEISVRWVIVIVDDDDEICELCDTNNEYRTHVASSLTNEGSTDTGGRTDDIAPSTYAAIIVSTALVTTVLFAVMLKLYTAGKLSKLAIPGLGGAAAGYSKIRQDDLLNNETRESVYDYIREHPGAHFRSIMSNLDLSNGTLSHHLQTLEKGEFIKSEKDGVLRRYYPRGRKFTGEIIELNSVQRKIMTAIAINPGISQKELAKKVGISAPTVNYHVNGLKAARLVEIKRHGKKTELFVIKRGS